MMKKITLLVVSMMLTLGGMLMVPSCVIYQGTPQVEFGYDLDKDGTLSFDNFDILYYLSTCQQMKTALENRGFVSYSKGFLLHPTACTLKEAKKMVQAAVNEVNLAQLAKDDEITQDFVVRCRVDNDADWTEIFRGN